MMEPITGSRLTDLRVAELMTIDPITVSVEAPVEYAEDLMRRNHISGLPVVDLVGHLVGVISQTDLLFLGGPSVRALIRHRRRGVRIGDVMSTPPVTIDSAALVRDAAIRMAHDHLHRLVVVDDHGRPVGVISSMDFVALAAEG